MSSLHALDDPGYDLVSLARANLFGKAIMGCTDVTGRHKQKCHRSTGYGGSPHQIERNDVRREPDIYGLRFVRSVTVWLSLSHSPPSQTLWLTWFITVTFR